MRTIYTFLVSVACLFGVSAWGQVSFTSTGITYSQDFNTLASTGTANPQSGGIFAAGWSFLEGSSNANLTYAFNDGSNNTGNTYSFGTTPADRALGMFQSS